MKNKVTAWCFAWKTRTGYDMRPLCWKYRKDLIAEMTRALEKPWHELRADGARAVLCTVAPKRQIK